MRSSPDMAAARPALVAAAVAALAAFAPPSPGQAADAGRRPTFARVQDERGEALAGAVVVFAGCVPHLGSGGPQDVQVVAADERGRAQARLRSDLCYLAWAARETGGDRISELAGWFAAGALFDLVCRPSTAERRTTIRGVEAWAEHGPLRFVARAPSPGPEQELVLADGAVELPLWPRVEIEVRTADGLLLWHAPAALPEWQLPAPQRLAVAVVDEAGAPLAGARILHRLGRLGPWPIHGAESGQDGEFRELGATDADGKAEVVFCATANPLVDASASHATLLFARAEGRAAVAGGSMGGTFYVDDHKVQRPPRTLTLRLQRSEPLVGSVGAVPRGTIAHLAVVAKLNFAARAYVHDPRTFTAPVGDDGLVRFDELPADLHSCRLTLLPPSGPATSLPLFPALTGRALPLAVPNAGATAPFVPCSLSLQVVDVHGGPARGAVAVVSPAGQEGVLVRDAWTHLPLDESGRLEARLAPGSWHVMAATATGWVVGTFVLEPGELGERLVMEPMAEMRLCLRGDDGRPLAGARVQTRGTRTVSTGEPLQNVLLHLRQANHAIWARLRTDADGALTVPFVPVKGHVSQICLEFDGRRTADFALEANEEPLDLRLQ